MTKKIEEGEREDKAEKTVSTSEGAAALPSSDPASYLMISKYVLVGESYVELAMSSMRTLFFPASPADERRTRWRAAAAAADGR